jgi:hypothetical protein
VLAQKNHLAFAILFHFFQLVLDDDGLLNYMFKIWVVRFEQLKLDLIIKTLEIHILFLLVGANVVDGVPRQLNEPVQVLIHHHTPLVQVREFLPLQLEGVAEHVLSSKMSLDSFQVIASTLGWVLR